MSTDGSSRGDRVPDGSSRGRVPDGTSRDVRVPADVSSRAEQTPAGGEGYLAGSATRPARWRPRAPQPGRNRGNRLLWTVVGLILLLGGIALALASLGRFGVDRTTPLIPVVARQRWNTWHSWIPWVAIAVGLLVAVLGLLLFRAQLHRRGGHNLPDRILEPAPGGPRGETVVSSSALSQALTADLQNHPGVTRAGVHLTGRPSRPQAYLRLAVTPEANVGEVRGYVDSALARFADTSGWRPELAEVTVRLADQPPPRVH